MHPMLNTAVKAARKAGSVINRASVDLDAVRIGAKGRSDFVTEVDHAAERALVGDEVIGRKKRHGRVGIPLEDGQERQQHVGCRAAVARLHHHVRLRQPVELALPPAAVLAGDEEP